METNDQEVQSQVVGPTPVTPVEDGDEVKDSQPVGEVEMPQPGADTKTLTSEEWSKKEADILSAKDKEIATYRQQMAQQYIKRWGEQVQAAERQAQAQDKGEVDQGLITEAEAGQRAQARNAQVQQQYQQAMYQAQVAEQRQQAQQMMSEAEQYGRVLAARDIGEKYGIKPEELLKDQSLTSPATMESKAASLALEKTRSELKRVQMGEQHFDQGQAGGAGSVSEAEKLKRRYPTM